jgi:hypothetical protein
MCNFSLVGPINSGAAVGGAQNKNDPLMGALRGGLGGYGGAGLGAGFAGGSAAGAAGTAGTLLRPTIRSPS